MKEGNTSRFTRPQAQLLNSHPPPPPHTHHPAPKKQVGLLVDESQSGAGKMKGQEAETMKILEPGQADGEGAGIVHPDFEEHGTTVRCLLLVGGMGILACFIPWSMFWFVFTIALVVVKVIVVGKWHVQLHHRFASQQQAHVGATNTPPLLPRRVLLRQRLANLCLRSGQDPPTLDLDCVERQGQDLASVAVERRRQPRLATWQHPPASGLGTK